ncbi:phage major capsid protein [Paracoccus sp. (in: a-proteobacteria)]|uniref:phage major capsid protein n=1 Tax=Paracoccus sp. TaxID=267 RepID=UPI00272BAC18|nr:phage major capsid protein [Paracoccus sp. (in: a-proteobacteria)]
MSETKTAEQLAIETKAAFEKSVDAVKAIAEEALGKAKSGETLAASIKERADEALTVMNELKARQTELEQKMARPGRGDERDDSLGEQFVGSDEFKGFVANQRQGASASLTVKSTDLTTATTNAAGSMGAGIVPTRAGMIELPRRRMTIRNLLMPGRTDGPLIEYEREVGFTNNAAPVAEGAAKPQSTMQIQDVQTRTKVIAHWFRVSKQTLSDVAQVRTLIDTRLMYGLALKEEEQILFGDGTGENLHGLVPQAAAFAPAFTPAQMTRIDRIRLAMLQVALAEYAADGTVLHPTDWAQIELTKDGEGRYIIGNPQGTAQPTLWGAPVIPTKSMTVGNFLTGAFGMAAQLMDQWDARIETGFQNDDFTRNKVTVLAEQRTALAVYRPEAFVTGPIMPAQGG